MVRVHFGPPLPNSHGAKSKPSETGLIWGGETKTQWSFEREDFKTENVDFVSTIWGVSSAGRAPALQAGGHRFDPGTLHQKRLTEASGNRSFIESLEDSKMYLEN